MSKVTKIKYDLEDVTSLVEIIQILKDIASNHFYNAAKRKERFEEFAYAFADFFRMVSLAQARSPLVQPENDVTAMLAITGEGGFMAEMTSKVVKHTVKEGEKYAATQIIVIGQKGVDKLKPLTDLKIVPFTNVEDRGLYQTTLLVKDYVVNSVLEGTFGRLYAVYPRAKTLNLIKPFTVKLLPSEELAFKQENVKDVIEKVIVESELDFIIHYLADLWLTCRIYEMLEDCVIAGYAAQSQQLEASLEKLKKDKKGLMFAFRKAKKSDIDKSLREVFTASLITG